MTDQKLSALGLQAWKDRRRLGTDGRPQERAMKKRTREEKTREEIEEILMLVSSMTEDELSILLDQELLALYRRIFEHAKSSSDTRRG